MNLSPDRHLYFNASDAPAMLGISPHETRQALLERIKYGISKPITPAVQAIFDAGHRIEALARPIAEALVGHPFPPRRFTRGKLGATLDGYYLDAASLDSVNWECKTLNDVIRKAFAGAHEHVVNRVILPGYLMAQMEHQLICSDSDKCLFMAHDGIETVHCWYYPDSIMRQRIIDGWAQFEKDLAAMPDVMPQPEYQQTLIPAKSESLPALRVELSGMVTRSNFAEYQSKAIAVFKGVNKSPTTDQDFADAAEFIKMAKGVRETIKQVKSQALKQTQTIDELFAGLDAIDAEAMRAERDLEAIVKARKDKLKSDKLRAAQSTYAAHIAALSVAKYMPPTVVNFAEAIKGKSSFDNIQQALDAELLRAQSAANITAAKVQKNLDLIEGADNSHLFYDIKTLVLKDFDDLENVIKLRLAEHAAKVAADAEKARLAALPAVEPSPVVSVQVATPVNMAALIDAEESRIERGESVPVFAISSAPTSAKINICASCGARIP